MTDNRRFKVKVPHADLVKLNFKTPTYMRDWHDIEADVVRFFGARYVGGDALCDGHVPPGGVKRAVGGRLDRLAPGACIEVKAHKGPYIAGGNWQLWTSMDQLNEVCRTNGVYVVVHFKTGNVYAVRGKKVKEYYYD